MSTVNSVGILLCEFWWFTFLFYDLVVDTVVCFAIWCLGFRGWWFVVVVCLRMEFLFACGLRTLCGGCFNGFVDLSSL